MKPRVLYPWVTWLMWALVVPALLAVMGGAAMLAAPSGALGFDGMSLVWLLLAAPAAVALGCYAYARRRAAMGRFVSDTLAPLLAAEVSPTRHAIRAALMVTALMLVGVALIGPRWGLYMEKTEAHGVDVVVAIDVSRSMLARDLAPNRLEYAKRTIREQLTERSAFGRMNRLGLLAFAGSTSMKVPLTLDQPFFRLALEQIDLGSAPRGGTAIAEAIYESAAFFKTSPKEAAKILLVFTDGEDHVGDPVAAAKEMFGEYGIVTYCIGVGDPSLPAGAEVPADATPGSKPLVHDGQIVFSKLNPEALSTIAEAGQGRYIPAADFGLLIGHLSQMQKQKITAEERQRRMPRYQWFLAAALLLLTIEPMIARRRRASAAAMTRVWQQEAA